MSDTKDATAVAKEVLAKNNEARAKSVEDAQAMHGKPTPTQEENDLAKLGVSVEEHEDDGSGPSPEFRLLNVNTRQSEAHKPTGGSYATRNATAERPQHSPSPSKETAKQ